MRAEAVIEVEQRDGRDVVTRLRSDPPLSIRRSGDVVHLVSSGAGPLGGDDLVLRIRVGAGASLTVASVAASMVLPGPTGASSRYRLEVKVGDGGRLTFLPEPQVLVRGCDHEMRSTFALGEGASLTWRDETVLGRHDEITGSLFHRVRIDRAGRPVLRSDLAVGPRWPESLGPGGLAGACALGTLVTAVPTAIEITADCGPGLPPSSLLVGEWVRSEALELGDGTVVVSAVGDSARAVRRGLEGARLVRT